MLRAKLVGSLGLVLCWASLAIAQDPPPLEAPAIEPETPKAAAPRTQPPATPPNSTARATPANPPVSAGSQVRPMLVIPGVTTPVRRPGATAKSAIPQPSSRPAPGAAPGAARRETGPAVAGPSDGGSPFRPGTGQPTGRSQRDALQPPIPMTLEPLEDEHEPVPRPRSSTSSRAMPDRSRTGSSRPAQKSAAETPVDDSSSASPGSRAAPRRLPGLLGRLFQPPPVPPARGDSRNAESQARKKADARPEPVTDASVKRKIEKQIRDTLGDRVRSVEVRVSGRNVLIVAQAARFWQKRTVRRALETLPGLSGYHARIELDD
jgi:hypothetical protein